MIVEFLVLHAVNSANIVRSLIAMVDYELARSAIESMSQVLHLEF